MTANPVLDIVRSGTMLDAQQLAKMGIHASHCAPAYKTAQPSMQEMGDLEDRMIERVNALSDSLINKSNLAHIVTDDLSDFNHDGLDYITRRINSGEAFGAELKDLRTLKAIADVIADSDAARAAIRSEDWTKLNRLMSKYSPSTKESRRSKSRAKDRAERAWRMAA